MAEYVLRHRARKAGRAMPSLQPAQATSVGTTGKTCTKARAVYFKQHGIDPSGFTSSKIKPSDAEHFDYIIVMDDNNLRETEKQLGFHPGKIFQTDRPYPRFRLQPRS